MAEEFLHRANVVPIFQEMRGEAVAHHVRANLTFAVDPVFEPVSAARVG